MINFRAKKITAFKSLFIGIQFAQSAMQRSRSNGEAGRNGDARNGGASSERSRNERLATDSVEQSTSRQRVRTGELALSKIQASGSHYTLHTQTPQD